MTRHPFHTLLATPQGCYPDGTWHQLKPLPQEYADGGWGAVLDRAQSAMAADGVLLLTGAEAQRLGLGNALPEEKDRTDHPALLDARGHGWKAKALTAWTTYQRPAERPQDRYALHVGVLDWMDKDDVPTAGLDAISTAALLHAWYMSFFCPWAGSSAVAGVTLIRHTARGPYSKSQGRFERPRWELPAADVREAWHSAASFRGMSWRPRRDDAPAHRYEHTYDVNKQWLNAASMTLLAHNRLEHTGPQGYDPKHAGFWLVQFEPWTRGHLLPDPAGARAAASDGKPVWVTTPRLGLVHELTGRRDGWQHPGYRVLDSWTAPGSLVLKPWAEALRCVLDDADLGPAAKSVYAKSLTTISKPGRRVYRPDWATSVVDMAHANLWRKLATYQSAGGPAPLKIGADQPTFPSNNARWEDDVRGELGAALGIGAGFGKLKHKSTAEVPR